MSEVLPQLAVPDHIVLTRDEAAKQFEARDLAQQYPLTDSEQKSLMFLEKTER